jgi:hypothetical protein
MRELYPGATLEATHGPNEAGRDILCVTQHAVLNQQYVICI